MSVDPMPILVETDWLEAHLSDPANPTFMFPMPPAEQFARVMVGLGVVDLETNTYRSPAELRALFAAVGAIDKERVITYCGGAIAASSAAFALSLIGVDGVALYDGSLTEWGADPSLPLEVGPAAD